jgi:hypothetical protein
MIPTTGARRIPPRMKARALAPRQARVRGTAWIRALPGENPKRVTVPVISTLETFSFPVASVLIFMG